MAEQNDTLKDLRALIGERLSETVEGKTIVFMPFEFERLPRMIELIEQAKDVIVIAGDALDIDTVKLLSTQYETALALMVEMSGQDEAWLRKLPADSALFVLAAYIRVNADFFIRRLAPIAMQAISSLGQFASPSASPSTSAPTATAANGATLSPS